MSAHTRLAAALSLVAAMSLTGANVAFGKAIVAVVPVYAFVFFRFLVASLALLAIVGREGGPALSGMTLGERRDLLLMSLLGMIGFTVLMFEGLKLTSASDAGIITATLPAAAALLGVVVMGDRLSRVQAAAIVLAVSGLVLVQVTGAAAGPSSFIGNLLVGGAVVCEASFVLLGKRLAPPYRPLRLALGANLVGLALSAPLVLAAGESIDWESIPWSIWLLGTWHALTASVLCLWLWYRALPYVDTWLAGLATAAVPVAALAASALFLGESIGGWKLAGAALVVGAIVLGALAPSAHKSSAGQPGPL